MPTLTTLKNQTLRSLGWLWRRWWGKTLYAIQLIAFAIFAYMQLRSDVLIADVCVKRGSTAEDPYCAKRMKMIVKREGASLRDSSREKKYPVFEWWDYKIDHPAAMEKPYWGTSYGTHIILHTEAIDVQKYYEGYMRVFPNEEVVNRMETKEIILVKQGKGNGWNSSLLTVVRSKNPIWFNCSKEYYSVNGTFNDNVGCRVYVNLFEDVILEYSIQRKHLYEWRSLNDKVISTVKSNIVNIDDFKKEF